MISINFEFSHSSLHGCQYIDTTVYIVWEKYTESIWRYSHDVVLFAYISDYQIIGAYSLVAINVLTKYVTCLRNTAPLL